MGSGLTSRKRREIYKMPSYTCSTEEQKCYLYCIDNNIRISPRGLRNEPGKWKIEIALGPYKKGEKRHVSPQLYDKDTIWVEYFKMCKYYYDKHRK